MKYQLAKAIWTQEDFDEMGWHDSLVYGVSFNPEFKLLFDIDYIFKWVLEGESYKFWISPCTLIFENCYDIRFDLGLSIPLEIQDLNRQNPKRPKNADQIGKETEFDWIMQTQQGEINFTSIGFKQYVKKEPVLLDVQTLGLEERGGVSFEMNLIK